jgi:urea transport system permease protein
VVAGRASKTGSATAPFFLKPQANSLMTAAAPSKLSRIVCLLLFVALLIGRVKSAAATPSDDALRAMSSADLAEVGRGITALADSGDPIALPVLDALDNEKLMTDEAGNLFIITDSGPKNPSASGSAAPVGKTRKIALNNVARRALDASVSRLRLTATSADIRKAAAKQLSEYPDEAITELLRSLSVKEQVHEVKEMMLLAVAKVDLRSDDKTKRAEAARIITRSSDIGMADELTALIEREPDNATRGLLREALDATNGRLFRINLVANVIYGMSLGSVLVLAALGLAITFGLMRVINMAHGEMLMLGAYSTFFIRERMLGISPGLAEWYLAAAIPFAFLVTFGMGVLLENLVIRHLYGRQLETLLATWGVSLVLIQIVRLIFGAQNVAVPNPDWLSGGIELMPALVVPYSRIAVLCFTALVVGFVAFVLKGTSVGLKVRAVTQNRETAAGLGIATTRVDRWTFGLGSGLAGLGGVALSQLGNVGPELGQQHIIDSFVVVVLGGVGNIWGTVLSGVGLGLANKIIEPTLGAVLAKILLLVLLILFIQWRPQGLFALKGRAAES